MDKKKSILNITVSLSFKSVMLIGTIIVRRVLINYVGNEIVGLESLYASIIGYLSVAELGIGTAITFAMYKPIVEKDQKKIAALYQLFNKVYRLIGLFIFILGTLLIPTLPYLAKDYSTANVNLGFTFILMLLAVVISYMYSAQSSLINAYKNNYITTLISSLGSVFEYCMQIVILISTRSFVAFLLCRILSISLQWIATAWWTHRKHGDILTYNKQVIDKGTKKELLKNMRAIFMHKIGGILVNSTDSLIISAFVGIVVLGKYSNYIMLAKAGSALVMLFFTPLTSIIGHAYVEEAERTKKYFDYLYLLNIVLGFVFFLGYYATIDNFIFFLFGRDLELEKAISFVITINYFVQFTRQATLMFKDATGTFYHDRWKPLLEGLLNAVLSVVLLIVFQRIWGEAFGVVGVLVATIVTNLVICHLVEPFVLYKYAFKRSVKKHYIKNYGVILAFIGLMFLLDASMVKKENQWLELFVNGLISIGYSVSFSLVLCMKSDRIRKLIFDSFSKLRNKKYDNM